MHHHQIDFKDLQQNHIDGKEFENAKSPEEAAKAAKEAPPADKTKSSS